jgi:hypothetical protein
MSLFIHDVIDEDVELEENRIVGQLEAGHYIPGTLRLYSLPGNRMLYEDHDWEGDPLTGRIDLKAPFPQSEKLSADYRRYSPESLPEVEDPGPVLH